MEDRGPKSGEVVQELSINSATLAQPQSKQGWTLRAACVCNPELVERIVGN